MADLARVNAAAVYLSALVDSGLEDFDACLLRAVASFGVPRESLESAYRELAEATSPSRGDFLSGPEFVRWSSSHPDAALGWASSRTGRAHLRRDWD